MQYVVWVLLQRLLLLCEFKAARPDKLIQMIGDLGEVLHVFNLKVTPCLYSNHRTCFICMMRFCGDFKDTTMSWRYTNANCQSTKASMTFIAPWKVTREYFSTNGILLNLYSPYSELKAVLSQSLYSIFLCPELPSNVENTVDPPRLLSYSAF